MSTASENLTIKLTTVIFLGGMLISAVVHCVTLKLEYDRNMDRLDNVRNRVFRLEHPKHPWSVDYEKLHPEVTDD